MLSNHKIQTALEEMKEISRTDFALYDDKEKKIAATFEPEEDILKQVGSFFVLNPDLLKHKHGSLNICKRTHNNSDYNDNTGNFIIFKYITQ